MIMLKKQYSLKQKTSSLFLNNFLPAPEELRITSFCLFVCLPAEIVCVKVDVSVSLLLGQWQWPRIYSVPRSPATRSRGPSYIALQGVLSL